MQVITTPTITCPICFESYPITVDSSEGLSQQFIYDCEVCCRPLTVSITTTTAGDTEAVASFEE